MKKIYFLIVLVGMILLLPFEAKAYTLNTNKNESTFSPSPVARKNDDSIEFEVNRRYTFKNLVLVRGGSNTLYVKPIRAVFNESVESINVRIGLIRNAKLLDLLMNEHEGAYESLLVYAKSDKYSTTVRLNLVDTDNIAFTGLLKSNNVDNISMYNYQGDIKYLNVRNGAYYYIYVEEEELVPEGIMLGQGNMYLLVNDVKWPNRTFITILTVIFTIYMCLPFLTLVYFIYLKKDKKEGN